MPLHLLLAGELLFLNLPELHARGGELLAELLEFFGELLDARRQTLRPAAGELV